MQSEHEIIDEQKVALKDVTEEDNLPSGIPLRRRKRKFVILGGSCALLLIAAAATYFLLTGKEVQVKSSRKVAERITSGSDLQKAAYDSLSGSLSGSVAGSPSNTSANNIGSGQRTTLAPVGAAPAASSASESERTQRVPALVQPGIAMTLSAPSEALLTEESKPSDSSQSANDSNPGSVKHDTNMVGARVVAPSAYKPKTTSSVLFSAPPGTTSTTPKDQLKLTAEVSKAVTDAGEKIIASVDTRPGLSKLKATPDFGAMLPVRLMGMLYTLRRGSLARLELVRDVRNDRWTLKRGTVFVGSLLGSELDRAFVQVNGFIDPETNNFTKLEGELLGSDGGAGLRGKQRRISPVWVKVLDRATQSGTQILTGALGRNSSVVVATDPYGAFRTTSESQNNRTFVEVPAGAVGFVLVTTLPVPKQQDSHLASTNSSGKDERGELSDAELADLFAEADVERIKLALPRMNPDLRRVAEATIKDIETANKQKGR